MCLIIMKPINDWYLKEVAPSELINNEYTQQAIQRGIASFNERINEYLVTAVSGIATFTFSVVSGIINALFGARDIILCGIGQA